MVYPPELRALSAAGGGEHELRLYPQAGLSAAPPLDETEVVADPEEGFDRWIPEGSLVQPGEPGKRLRVHLQARKKGEAGVARRASLVLSLVDVSVEKGVCGLETAFLARWGSRGPCIALLAEYEDLAAEDPKSWAVPALIRQLVAEGRSFADLNG